MKFLDKFSNFSIAGLLFASAVVLVKFGLIMLSNAIDIDGIGQ